MCADTLRVLVVDDTAIYRKIVSSILGKIPGVEVVGSAPNGKIAMQKIERCRVDLLTLDLEMPELDGLGVLKQLKASNSDVGAIMLSAFTSKGADSTMAALELGAFDFVLKPTGSNPVESEEKLRQDLGSKIEAYIKKREIGNILGGSRRESATANQDSRLKQPGSPGHSDAAKAENVTGRMFNIASGAAARPRIVVIGISTGGPQALNQMMPGIPADVDVPLLIVQHMPPLFTKSLADSLNEKCDIEVREAEEGDPVCAGQALIAPGGKQMKVRMRGASPVVQLTDDPPENSCRPSVDYLFRSVASHYGAESLGVVMTGMGNDGTLGCRLLKRRGATIMVQDEPTCVVYGMPKAVVDEGVADTIAPLGKIADNIVQLVRQGELACR